MAEEDKELEIIDGARAFSKTQELFVGGPLEKLYPPAVACGWYDEYVSEYRGAFMLAQEGSTYERLIGEFIKVNYKQKFVYVYCVNSEPDLETPIALARRAYLALERLTIPSIEVYPQVLT